MNYTIKKIALLLLLVVTLQSCLINNPKPEECDVLDITVEKIYEGGEKDIVFAEANGDFYYINRGLEQGYTLEGLRSQVLNKKVTLHMPRLFYGTSNHISQLELEGKVIFTEFPSETSLIED